VSGGAACLALAGVPMPEVSPDDPPCGESPPAVGAADGGLTARGTASTVPVTSRTVRSTCSFTGATGVPLTTSSTGAGAG
jgi:hypothetical protein